MRSNLQTNNISIDDVTFNIMKSNDVNESLKGYARVI